MQNDVGVGASKAVRVLCGLQWKTHGGFSRLGSFLGSFLQECRIIFGTFKGTVIWRTTLTVRLGIFIAGVSRRAVDSYSSIEAVALAIVSSRRHRYARRSSRSDPGKMIIYDNLLNSTLIIQGMSSHVEPIQFVAMFSLHLFRYKTGHVLIRRAPRHLEADIALSSAPAA